MPDIAAATERTETPPPRSRAARVALATALLLVVAVLVGLGTWQLFRLSWKLDLIARVDARVHEAPVAPPGPVAWAAITADADQYRHVTARGVFDNGRETLVLAVTEFGGGFWVLTPFRTRDGFTILVNRGFVPGDRRAPASRAAGEPTGETTVTGLLRVSEPGGAFLRRNDPAADRWYSRDVAAIALARGVAEVAPYFVDADAAPNPGGYPVGGLTVVSFPNNHLVYALTWFALAALLAAGAAWAVRQERRAVAVDVPGSTTLRAS